MHKIRSGADRLVLLFPSLPYLAFGTNTAWTLLLMSGNSWISDVTLAETAIFDLIPRLAVGGMIAGLLMILLAKKLDDSHGIINRVLLFASMFAGVAGVAMVLFAGPYFQTAFHISDALMGALFIAGSILAGFCEAIQLGFCFVEYSKLSPAAALTRTLQSYVLASVLVLLVSGSSLDLAPFEGSPTWFSMSVLLALPMVSTGLLLLFRNLHMQTEPISYRKLDINVGNLSMVLLLVLLLSVTNMVHFWDVASRSAFESFFMNDVWMYIRLVTIAVLFCIICLVDFRKLSFGDIYSRSSIVLVILLSLIPLVGVHDMFSDMLAGFLLFCFELTVWCVACLVCKTRQYSPFRLYGLMSCAIMLSYLVAWVAARDILPLVIENGVLPWLFTAILAMILVLLFFTQIRNNFSELLNFDEGSIAFDEIVLGDIPSDELVQESAVVEEELLLSAEKDKRGHFVEAVESISAKFDLTEREQVTLGYLARGWSNARISEELMVSINTVRTHAQNVYHKVGVHSRQELMTFVDDEMRREKD